MTKPRWSLAERANRLQAAHSRISRWAAIVSIALHAVAFFSLHDINLSPEPSRPAVIGYEGPLRVVELAPRDEVLRSQQDLARRRIQVGAIRATELLVQEPEPAAPRLVRSEVNEPRPAPPQPEPEPEPAGPEEPLVIELGEDWSPGSVPEAFSDQFQVLHMVRPEYPVEAIERNQQGLVRLEVRVGISGRVLNVRILESPYGSRPLERAAVQSILDWEFRPFHVDDRIIPFTVIVPFRFRLVD